MGALVWLDGVSDDDAEAPLASELTAKVAASRACCARRKWRMFSHCRSRGSAALVAIRSGEDAIAVLGVGSHDTQRYRTEDGTLFLEYLAEVIGQLPASG